MMDNDAGKFFLDAARRHIEAAILDLQGFDSCDRVKHALWTALYQLDIQVEKREQE